MTEYQRSRLRTGFESVVRIMTAGVSPTMAVTAVDPYSANVSVVCESPAPDAPPPPLTPAQQLALSVLLGDESVTANVLADYLIDQGHEYATAVAEKATMAERVRCVKLMSPVLNDRLFDKTAHEAREAMRYPTGEYDQAFNDAWYADTKSD